MAKKERRSIDVPSLERSKRAKNGNQRAVPQGRPDVNRKRSTAQNSGKKRPSGKKRKKKMALGTRILLGICGVLLILVIAAIGVLANKISKLNIEELDTDKLSISDELTYDEHGYLNVALFGLDTRKNNEEMGNRSDTIMIASLNRETKDLKLASIYRDTLLQQEDGTYNKANAAYSFGEEEEAIAMLNRNLDMDIQHYVTVDFSAMVDVIDALGGIEIDVTEEEIPYLNNYSVEIIENTGVDTWAVEKPGLQNLTGVQATAYARIRYTEGDDYKRAERQRTVLAKIAQKAQGASLSTLSKIIDKVFPKVETNFKLTEILAYAKDVKKYKLGETVGFPFEKETMIFGDAGDSVIPVNLVDNVQQLHEYLFGTEDGYTPTSTVCEISDEIVYLTGKGEASGYSGTGTYDNGTGSYGTGTYDDGTGAYGTGTYDDGTGSYGTGTYDDGTGSYGDGTGTYDDGTGAYGTGTYDDGTGSYGDGAGTYDDGTGSYGDGTGTYDDSTGTYY